MIKSFHYSGNLLENIVKRFDEIIDYECYRFIRYNCYVPLLYLYIILTLRHFSNKNIIEDFKMICHNIRLDKVMKNKNYLEYNL